MAAALRPLEYYKRSSSDDLFASQALSATFFAQIASLTSSFNQGVLLSLLFVPTIRLRPQQLVADVMTAVQNKHHSVLMSSVEVGSSLNLDAILSANAVRTFLFAKIPIGFDMFFVVEKCFVMADFANFNSFELDNLGLFTSYNVECSRMPDLYKMRF